jgi:methenyltetrahydromethanopterin cyclohydrolase
MTTLNERAYELANAMAADAEKLGIEVSTLECGTRIIDCGVRAQGSAAAGIKLAYVCMGGAGNAELCRAVHDAWDGPGVRADCENDPIGACMASQYAGWAIKGDKFFAMGSGPMRAASCREELFQEIGRCERATRCVGVLETSQLPPDAVCIDIAEKCGITPDQLTLLVARTSSEAGTIQIVARSVETALHKLHALKFDLGCIRGGWGIAPIPPRGGDDMVALGRTNDAILYGTSVHLVVEAEDEALQEIGPRVPSNSSPDYGRPFGEIFARYEHDFYRVDPMLFSPAQVTFLNRSTGRSLRFGEFAPAVLAESFAESAKK